MDSLWCSVSFLSRSSSAVNLRGLRHGSSKFCGSVKLCDLPVIMDPADKALITKNTSEFVKDLDLNSVLDRLMDCSILNEETCAKLRYTNAGDRYDKVREFLGVITRRGSKAFNSFYEALCSTSQHHLAKLLRPKEAKEIKAIADAEVHLECVDAKPIPDAVIDIPLKVVQPDKLQSYLQLLTEQKAYKMTKPRGRVLVINNNDFSRAANNGKVIPNRDGTMRDAENLKRLFDDLEFVYVEKCDLTAEDMREVIKNEIKNKDHEKFGMFVLVILSHGVNGAVEGVDGSLLKISEIKQLLGPQHFIYMAGKPKLVLLQACQDDAVVPDTKDGQETTAKYADILVAYATSQGDTAYRNPLHGTPFIRGVVRVFRENVHEDHVLDMLTKVGQLVDQESDAKQRVQWTFNENYLHKSLYLVPGWSG